MTSTKLFATFVGLLFFVIPLLLLAGVALSLPQNFNMILGRTLVHEGGYSNDAGDPGGPTKYGITIHDVRMYLNRSATAQDVRNLTLEQARVIYKAHYWDAVNADMLPAGLDYSVFDYAVNAGIGRAIPAHKQCVAKYPDNISKQITCVNIEKRLAFQLGLTHMSQFHRGWKSRILSVEAGAQADYRASQGMRSMFDLDTIPRYGPGKAE